MTILENKIILYLNIQIPSSYTSTCYMLKPGEIQALQLKITENNDDNSFEQLYMSFIHNLQKFAFSKIKSGELAEEIVSDVFIKIWQNRARL